MMLNFLNKLDRDAELSINLTLVNSSGGKKLYKRKRKERVINRLFKMVIFGLSYSSIGRMRADGPVDSVNSSHPVVTIFFLKTMAASIFEVAPLILFVTM